MRSPLKYFRNNVSNTINLLNVMDDANVYHLVYSSSAAVYGNPLKDSISESDPLSPVNPYGLSKLVVEKMIRIGHLLVPQERFVSDILMLPGQILTGI